MSKRLALFIPIVFLFLGITIIDSILVGEAESKKHISSETSQSDITLYKYKVSVFNGKIAVFEFGEKLPMKTYEVYVEDFPQEDKDLLNEGINVENKEELISIIEDYTS